MEGSKTQKLIPTLQKVKRNLAFVLLLLVFTATGLFFAYRTFIPALAVGTFGDDFVTIDEMDDNSDSRWIVTETGGNASIGVAGDLTGIEPDFALQTHCGSNSGCTNAGMKKGIATTNMASQQIWFYFHSGAVTQGDVEDVVTNVELMLCNGAVGAANSLCGGENATWLYCNAEGGTSDCSDTLVTGWNNIKFFSTQPTTESSSFDITSVASLALSFDTAGKMTAKSGFPGQAWVFMEDHRKRARQNHRFQIV